MGQVFLLKGVGHHTRRRLRSVEAARVSSRVCGKHVEPQESLGGPAAVATPGPRLRIARAGFTRATRRCMQRRSTRSGGRLRLGRLAFGFGIVSSYGCEVTDCSVRPSRPGPGKVKGDLCSFYSTSANNRPDQPPACATSPVRYASRCP